MAGRRQMLRVNQASDMIEISCESKGEYRKMCDFHQIQGRILKTVDSVYQDIEDLEGCKQK